MTSHASPPLTYTASPTEPLDSKQPLQDQTNTEKANKPQTKRKRPCKVVYSRPLQKHQPHLSISKTFRLDHDALILFDPTQQNSYSAGLSQANFLKSVQKLTYNKKYQLYFMDLVNSNSNDNFKIHYQSLNKKLLSSDKSKLASNLERIRKFNGNEFLPVDKQGVFTQKNNGENVIGLPQFIVDLFINNVDTHMQYIDDMDDFDSINNNKVQNKNRSKNRNKNKNKNNTVLDGGVQNFFGDQNVLIEKYQLNGKNKIILQGYVLNQNLVNSLGFSRQEFEQYVQITGQIPPINRFQNQYFQSYEKIIDCKLDNQMNEYQFEVLLYDNQQNSNNINSSSNNYKNHNQTNVSKYIQKIKSFKFTDPKGNLQMIVLNIFEKVKDGYNFNNISQIQQGQNNNLASQKKQVSQQFSWQQEQQEQNTYEIHVKESQKIKKKQSEKFYQFCLKHIQDKKDVNIINFNLQKESEKQLKKQQQQQEALPQEKPQKTLQPEKTKNQELKDKQKLTQVKKTDKKQQDAQQLKSSPESAQRVQNNPIQQQQTQNFQQSQQQQESLQKQQQSLYSTPYSPHIKPLITHQQQSSQQKHHFIEQQHQPVVYQSNSQNMCFQVPMSPQYGPMVNSPGLIPMSPSIMHIPHDQSTGSNNNGYFMNFSLGDSYSQTLPNFTLGSDDLNCSKPKNNVNNNNQNTHGNVRI